MKNSTNPTATIQQAVDSYKKESTVPAPRGGKWIEEATFEETASALGKSFAGNENVAGKPMFDWFLNHLDRGDDGWFTNKERIEVCTYIMKFELMKLMRKGTLIVSKQVDDEAVSAVVLVEHDPTKPKGIFGGRISAAWEEFQVTFSMMTQHKFPSLFVDKKHKEDVLHFEKKGTGMLNQLTEWHEELCPQELHWYVKIVGVVPDHGGKGYGREILERVNELADKAGVACYLECAASRKGFYEKVGYRIITARTFQGSALSQQARAARCLREPVSSSLSSAD